MRNLSTLETRDVNGGASKYVYCPICNYKYKVGFLDRLWKSNTTIAGYLQSRHGWLRNKRYYGSNSQAVHR